MPTSTKSKDSRFKDALWYAAAAGAVVGLGAPAAQAQIVYQDLDPDLNVQDTWEAVAGSTVEGIAVDLDDDGDSEILFGEASNGIYTIGSFNDDDGADVVTAIAGNLIDYGGTNYAYFLPLEAGSTISSAVASVTGYGAATFTFGGSDPNGFIGIGDTYIGFQFTLDTGTSHYAWMRIEVPEAGLLIVKDFAFNATPDAPIQAGEMGTVANEDDATGLGGALSRIETYPNPFADELQYKLEVAAAQEVEVGVYDVLGRRVATLHEGVLAAGSQHTFTLRGSELPNGLYLIQAKGEQFSETTRVTLSR